MNTRFKPAFRYELRNLLLGCTPFFAILAAIVMVSVFVNVRYNADITFSGYGITCAIGLFVFGIVEPRPCLRLCAQLGVSRRTGFLCNMAAAFLTILALALGGELLLTAGKVLGGGQLFLADLYELIYLENWKQAGMYLTLPQHCASFLFNTLLMTTAYSGGMFFTYVFWRLNKLWTVVAAISIPVLLNGIPLLVYNNPAASRAAGALFNWLLASVWNLLLLFLFITLVVCGICWLLVRRANIKAPTGK